MSAGSGDEGGRMRRAFRLPTSRRRLRREVDDELRFHLEGRVEELMAGGMSRAAAEAEARRRFGDVDRVGEECEAIDASTARRRRWTERLEALGRDVRHAARALARRPGFTATVVLTLALGIGANAAVFSAVEAVLLRPFPFPRLDRLVVVREDLKKLGLLNLELSPPEVLELAERHDLFATAGAYAPTRAILSGTTEPRQVHAARTIGDFFPTLGVRPYLGRFYTTAESEEGQHMVAVIDYGLWQELSGGDPSFVGRSSIQINGRAMRVVGVMPAGASYPRGTRVWFPHVVNAQVRQTRFSEYLTFVGRLQPAITPERLRAGLDAQVERWRSQYDYDQFSFALYALPFADFHAGQLRPILLVLLGAVAFVLLIACANVASLQLLRAVARGREQAVRAALGAGRWPLVRQSLAETGLLALGGGVLGVAVGAALLRVLAHWRGADELALQGVRLDGRVLALAMGVTVAAALLFGLVPALRAGRVRVHDALKEAARGSSAGAGRHHFLQAAVVLQVALTLALLLGSGLTIRSLARLVDTDPGFRPQRLTTFRVSVPGVRYPDEAAKRTFFEGVAERLRAAPGVRSVGLTNGLPFTGDDDSSPFKLPGRPPLPGTHEYHAAYRIVDGDYFRTMGIPLVRGRTFGPQDRDTVSRVLVIDESLANQYFPGEDPVGKRLSQGPEGTIVGVVGAVRQSAGSEIKPTVYWPYGQSAWLNEITMAVRSDLPPETVFRLARAAAAARDPQVPVHDLRTMTERMDGSLGARRLAMTVLTGFAALSLLLAVLGVYGVLSYSARERTHEIGIRMALGARPGDVERIVLGRGLALTGAGLAAGLVLFLAVGRLLASLLYGVGPRDPVTLLAAAGLLASVAALAAYVPARRAARVDPTVALRAE